MYINKIDELIDSILDKLYTIILKDKFMQINIKNEKNFIKFQKEINEMLTKYFKLINIDEIEKIITNKKNINGIVELLKGYIAYYTFFMIGYYSKGSQESYINNIIEFTKNQPGYNVKIKRYFTSNSNRITIDIYSKLLNILTLLVADKKKLEFLMQKQTYIDAGNILNELGNKYVTEFLILKNIDGDKNLQIHNLIKTLIITQIYIKIDKTDIFNILESAHIDSGEYIFINIVLPKKVLLDFNVIESTLSRDESADGLAYRIYDAILSTEKIVKDISINEKILFLINNKILVPIVDDFLLYHKDTERYDLISDKKKDHTRIKYIINKIDTVKEYYSSITKKDKKIKDKIEKIFVPTLKNKKAIVVNDLENIRIIDKLNKQGKVVSMNNEYYSDLLNYMKYPYINFKDFDKYGFRLVTNKTVDVVRRISLNNNNKHLQIRVGSNKMENDIIGFFLTRSDKPIEFINMDDTDDIHNSGKNGYRKVIDILKNTTVKGKQLKKNMYWKIDLNKDKISLDKYQNTGKLTQEEITKILIADIYDKIISESYSYIYDIISKNKRLSLFSYKQLMYKYEKKIYNLPKNNILYDNFNIYTFKNLLTIKDKYDEREDIFTGIGKNAIKIPTYKENVTDSTISIVLNLSKKRENIEKQQEKYESILKGAVCQHNITWEKITSIRRNNPNKFTNILTEFIFQYVIEDDIGDYICKSCGVLLPIKTYIQGGVFDEDGRYTSFSQQMIIPLENIPEYEKYIPSIQNIDKIIDRLSSIANFSFLYEKSASKKNETKKRIIKNTIDMLLIHNKVMKKNYKYRSENIIQKYGVNREYSNLFIFELDNSIFTYSSKDKDFYKFIKKNNILAYIIFFLLLELNDTHVIYMGSDKLCNFFMFTKIKNILFQNIKIITNNTGKLDFITNYPVLCYMVFYISCMMTKYNMWFKNEEQKNTGQSMAKKYDPMIQKMIIHTLIDLVNSFLERTDEYNNDYIYKITINRLYNKLATTFKNNDIMDKLERIHSNKIVTENGKQKYKMTKINSIKIPDTYSFYEYNLVSKWELRKCNGKILIPLKKHILPNYIEENNITNCESGEIHDWKISGNIYICSICNKRSNSIKYDDSLTQNINRNISKLVLQKYSDRYCKTGIIENYANKVNRYNKIYSKCKNVSDLKDNELEDIFNIYCDMIQSQYNSNQKMYRKLISIEKNKNSAYYKKLSEYKKNYSYTKNHKEDFLNYIEKFVNKLKNIIGPDININGDNIFLDFDAYIIDHDHNGYKIDKPFVIKDNGNKILYKKNHPYFKKDVFYYINNKFKVKVFYDNVTKLLLGYQEYNKDYKDAKVGNIFLKINYSIKRMLKLLGYKSAHINIQELKRYVESEYDFKDEQIILQYITARINRDRLSILKKVISNTQRYINRIIYGYSGNNIDKLTEKYIKKLKNMQTFKNEKKIFKDWKIFINNLNINSLDNKVINIPLSSQFVISEDFNYYDYHGNLALFYIINEFTHLIDYNSSKLFKNTVIYFVLDIIIDQYKLYEEEIKFSNYEIRKFNYLLESKYLLDVKLDSDIVNTEGIYGEYIDPDVEVDEAVVEQQIDNQEELDSIDVDTEIDYQIDYD